MEFPAKAGYLLKLKELNMRKAAIVIIVLLAAAGAFAAPVDFASFQTSFDSFAKDLASGLPFNASTGLAWSEAALGQFPHFGVGVTVGATTIPAGTVNSMVSALGVTLPSEFSYVAQYGIPVPAYTIDARLGGFVLPFDIGLKFGYIPAGALQKAGVSGVTADYILAGADVRFAVLRDHGFVPALSIGVGYNYMKGSVGVAGLLGSSIDIANFTLPDNSTHTLNLSDPTLNMAWSTNVVEAKVQLSKRILFITPYIGAAASYSFGAQASGAVQSTLYYDGHAITQNDINNIDAAFAAAGKTPPDLSPLGITANATSAAGFSYRAFGGLSFDIFFIYLDVGAAYNILSGSLGGSLNLRLAL
jgi:hypothetical protein